MRPTLLLLAASLTVATAASAQRVVRHTETDATAEWSDVVSNDDAVTVGFSFDRVMSKTYYFQRTQRWEMQSTDPDWDDGPSLMQITTGRVPDDRSLSTADAVRRTAEMVLVELGRLDPVEALVAREVGFLVTYRSGRAVDSWLGNVELSPRIDTSELHWFGHLEPAAALDVLERLFDQTTGHIREGVVAAIGAQSEPDRVIPMLGRILENDAEEDVRDEAASWLGRQHDPRAVTPLVRAVNRDASRQVKEEAIESLGDLHVEGAYEALAQIAESHTDVAVRAEAVESLAERRDARAARLLERIALRDRERRVQVEAVEGLSEMPPDLAQPLLASLLQTHPTSSIRSEVAEALGERASDVSVVALKRAAESDQSSSVRSEALEALAEMPSGAGIPAVIDLAMNHPSSSVRREAIEQLGDSRDARARAALVTLGVKG